jgi:hypothetical protein
MFLMKTRSNLMKTAAVVLGVTLSLALPVMAGRIWLEFGNPAASTDPKAKDALAVVRATGCHEPEKALYTATAEGKIEGKRKTIPLEVVQLSTPGTYAIKGTLPKEGAWVIAVNSTLNGSFLASAILPVSSKGVERTLAKTMPHPLSDDDVAQALRP